MTRMSLFATPERTSLFRNVEEKQLVDLSFWPWHEECIIARYAGGEPDEVTRSGEVL